MSGLPCPVCDDTTGETLLRRSDTPVHQNLTFATAAEAKAARRGDLELAVCRGCGFLWNAAFRPELMSYGDRYDHAQTFSGTYVRHHAERLAAVAVAARDARHIVELGCGEGEFLQGLMQVLPTARGLGIDPAYAGPLERLAGRLKFAPSLIDQQATAARADVIIARHLLAHLPRPLECVAAAADGRAGVQVFVETPDAAETLAAGAFWDFFYEYCSYFTATSLELAMRRAGVARRRLEGVYGGQYLWFEGETGALDPTQPGVGPAAQVGAIVEAARDVAVAESTAGEAWRRFTDQVGGDVAVWGAAAKGGTLVNIVDPQTSNIRCVIDLNPRKQGGFIGGSGHPIVSPLQAKSAGVRTVVVMNPAYRSEIEALVAVNNLGFAVVEVNDALAGVRTPARVTEPAAL